MDWHVWNINKGNIYRYLWTIFLIVQCISMLNHYVQNTLVCLVYNVLKHGTKNSLKIKVTTKLSLRQCSWQIFHIKLPLMVSLGNQVHPNLSSVTQHQLPHHYQLPCARKVHHCCVLLSVFLPLFLFLSLFLSVSLLSPTQRHPFTIPQCH